MTSVCVSLREANKHQDEDSCRRRRKQKSFQLCKQDTGFINHQSACVLEIGKIYNTNNTEVYFNCSLYWTFYFITNSNQLDDMHCFFRSCSYTRSCALEFLPQLLIGWKCSWHYNLLSHIALVRLSLQRQRRPLRAMDSTGSLGRPANSSALTWLLTLTLILLLVHLLSI